jgi:NAD(P)-dependent dehydrogenase (short-subunit alcohol dehydrogenase family)
MDTILITGGNGEMAKQIVTNFSKKFNFLLLDLQDNLNPELISYSVKYLKCDICDLKSLKKIHEIIIESNQTIVAIINNAAIDFVPSEKSSNNEDYSSDMALKVLNVNVVGAINVIEVFKESIIESKGSIINISSIYSKVPPDQNIYSEIMDKNGKQFRKPIYYGLSKCALNYVTKYYVDQLSLYGVNVNTIIFGGIESNQPESFKIRYKKKVPLNRMCQWEDVINIFSYLLSEKSSYITGNEFCIDGGFLCFK